MGSLISTVSNILSLNFKPFLFIPIIGLNTTLSLVESLQRYFTFDRPQLVGHVNSVMIAPVCTTKMMHCTSWRVLRSSLPLDRRIAVYDKRKMEKLVGGWGLGSKLTGVESRSEVKQGVECDVSCASVWDMQVVLSHKTQDVDLKIDMGALQSRKRIFGLKSPGEDGTCDYREYVPLGEEADKWMTRVLGGNDVILLYQPDIKLSGELNTAIYRGQNNEVLPRNPVLITCTSTLNQMNKAAQCDLEMERFRPNIVLTGTKPRAEHLWKIIRIGEQLELEQTFMSPRCSMINSLAGKLNNKAYGVLYKHGPFKDRSKNTYFGTYWRVLREGKVRKGDRVVVLKRSQKELTYPRILTGELILGSI